MATVVLEILATRIPNTIKSLQADDKAYLEEFLELREHYLKEAQDEMQPTIDALRAKDELYNQVYERFKDITVENLRDMTYMDEALRSEIFRDAFIHVPEVTNNFIKNEAYFAEVKELRIGGYSPHIILHDPQAFIDGLQVQRHQAKERLYREVEAFIRESRYTNPPRALKEADTREQAGTDRNPAGFELLKKREETIRSQIKAAEDAGYTDHTAAQRMGKSLDKFNQNPNRRNL